MSLRSAQRSNVFASAAKSVLVWVKTDFALKYDGRGCIDNPERCFALQRHVSKTKVLNLNYSWPFSFCLCCHPFHPFITQVSLSQSLLHPSCSRSLMFPQRNVVCVRNRKKTPPTLFHCFAFFVQLYFLSSSCVVPGLSTLSP